MTLSRFALLLFCLPLTVGLSLSGCTSSKQAKDSGEKTLHLATVAKIKGLDPINTIDLYSANQAALVYEGLLQYHYLKRPYVLEPALATSLPKISKNQKVFTFQIKKGVLFQDDPCFKATKGKGREVTAEDFVYSLKRLADPKNNSSGWWILDGKVEGLNEWREAAQKSGKTDYSKNVKGLKVVDPYTFQIRLKKPSYQFQYLLATPYAAVVPKEAVDHYGKDFFRNPVGTGPYVLDRKESNLSSKLIWRKNPTYRESLYPSEGEKEDKAAGLLKDAGKKLPFAEKVIVKVFTESDPMWYEFLSGKLDRMGIPKDFYQQAVTPSKELTPEFQEKRITLYKSPDLDLTYVAFNMEDPVLGMGKPKNKYLRQAISLVYNPEPLIEIFYNGRALPAQSPIPPGLSGYDPNYKNPYRQFDLAKAKRLMKKAGYPNGKGLPPITLTNVASSTERQFGEYFVKAVAPLGIKVKINSLTWPQFIKTLKTRKGQVYGLAWKADYPDAENFLQLFYSKNASPGPNDSNYSNSKYDQLYEKSLRLPPSKRRTKIYRQMVDILVEDAPYIFGVHRLSFSLSHPWLKNYKLHKVAVGTLKYWNIDPSQK